MQDVAAGAAILPDVAAVFAGATMIVEAVARALALDFTRPRPFSPKLPEWRI